MAKLKPNQKDTLPVRPGAVVNVDGDRAMLTKFGNWVTEGVFTMTNEQILAEDYVVEHDPGWVWSV